ncbi:MAG: acyl-CoA dehydrogenase family protein [Pseudomonadota bacterium]
MDLRFHDDLADFREEVRGFIRAHLPDAVRERQQRGMAIDRATMKPWHDQLVQKGWAARGWPEAFGGAGFTPAQQYVFHQVMAEEGAPLGHLSWGFSLVAPTIVEYGSQWQKDFFLPRILRGEIYWCQGFSEPNAGSDLAALKCRADRDGDDYVINGSKIWTSYALQSDWMFGIFRTAVEDRPQKGISMFLIDMQTPGISVEPIPTYEGGAEINQTFFTDVRVPARNLLGGEGQGWELAKFQLGRERYNVAQVAVTKALLRRLKRFAREEAGPEGSLLDDPQFSDRLYRFEMELAAFESVEHFLLYDHNSPAEQDPDRMTLLKIRGADLHQAVTELTLDALGTLGLPDLPAPATLGSNDGLGLPDYVPGRAAEYFNTRKVSIYGGSNEIQRNIIAKNVLGL